MFPNGHSLLVDTQPHHPVGLSENWIAQNLMLENPVFPTQVAINCWHCSMSPPFSNPQNPCVKFSPSYGACHKWGYSLYRWMLYFMENPMENWWELWVPHDETETSKPPSPPKKHLRISAPSCREPSNGFPGPTSPWTSHLDEEGTRKWWKKPVKRTSDVY